MKFGKEFASQMAQEWQGAYMDYNYLKNLLKNVLQFRQRNATTTMAATPRGSLARRVSLYRAFSGLTSRYRVSPRKDNEDEVILMQEEGSEGNLYKTMFVRSSEDGGEYELVFFRRLDDEFNKVVKFCKEKVEEVMEGAEELDKQMDALIALRVKVDRPVVGLKGAQKIHIATYGSASISPESISPQTPPINGRKPGIWILICVELKQS